jgi:hypothetical protein
MNEFQLFVRKAIVSRAINLCIPALLLFLICLQGPARSLFADEKVSFGKQIRPILAEHCYQCHGPDPDTREADLRLDLQSGAMADLGGYAAIVPGNIEQSHLWERIIATDEDELMPPTEFKKPLKTAQIELLKRWIQQGADYEQHWSLIPISKPTLPDVKNVEWPINAIDRFILAELEAKQISPAPQADRFTLVRRVYLDLLGLPPTIQQIETFVNDPSPDAYTTLLDRVLANPHLGERWGRHWLDQARYADSHGYTNDDERSMWPYRDWVIAALNADLPFDQFTIEQLAGDLLENPTDDQLIATGFHRNTLINTEGGSKPDQFHDEQTKDRVDTTGLVWMGLTVGCAKCHTHKYDPIQQKEYYQLYAFFNSSQDRNSVAPTLTMATPSQRNQLQELDIRIAALKDKLATPDPEREARRDKWISDLAASDSQEAQWYGLPLNATSKHLATFQQLEDHSLLVSGIDQADDVYTISAELPAEILEAGLIAIKLEALNHASLPQNGPGRAGNGNLVLSDIHIISPKNAEVRFHRAWADHSQPSYDVAGAIDNDPRSGWAINGSPEGGANHDRVAHFVLTEPLHAAADEHFKIVMRFNNGTAAYNLGRFRISASAHAPADKSQADLIEIAKLSADARSKEQQQLLEDSYDKMDPVLKPLRDELAGHEAEKQKLEKQFPTTMIMREQTGAIKTHLQIRGDFLRTGDELQPGVPAVLPPLPAAEKHNRLDLARWLVNGEHPLTARVQANRFWMRLFGKGLVQTEDDFGTQGTLPTHPRLLDWLASEFQSHGWSTKRMLKIMMSSATYRQSSVARSDLLVIDPENNLLGRQNRIRVEAEIVRDAGLVASGLYSDRIGGPSVYPPQPDGVYAFTQVAKNWKTNTDADRYRRGIYTFFYRSAPHPLLSTFDVPNLNQVCTRRERSNTPLQSLTVANDQAMFEMAQAFADRILQTPADDRARLNFAFQTCFARTPQSAELARLQDYLDLQRKRWASQQEPERSAWIAVARLLINLDEFITRE